MTIKIVLLKNKLYKLMTILRGQELELRAQIDNSDKFVNFMQNNLVTITKTVKGLRKRRNNSIRALSQSNLSLCLNDSRHSKMRRNPSYYFKRERERSNEFNDALTVSHLANSSYDSMLLDRE